MRPSIAVQQHRTEILAMLQKYRSQTHGSLDQLYVPLYEGVRHEFYDNDDLREWLVQYFDDYVVENQPVKGTYGLIWFLSKQNSIPGSFAVKTLATESLTNLKTARDIDYLRREFRMWLAVGAERKLTLGQISVGANSRNPGVNHGIHLGNLAALPHQCQP